MGLDLPVSLVLAGTSQGNGSRVALLHERLAARGYANLRLRHLSYSNGHVAMDEPSFTQALAFVFEGP